MSVIIPAFNASDFIGDAIKSVLAQTHRELDCIVVDDGSTDDTPELVERFNHSVRLIALKRGGVSRARNVGASAAKGECLAFLDADDVWEPEKLEKQITVLHARERPFVMCSMAVVDSDLRVVGCRRMSSETGSLRDLVMFDGSTVVSCSSTALITRSAFESLEGFDERLSMSADWDLLARFLLREGSIGYVDEPLVRYRVHDANMSFNVAALEHDMSYCFQKFFADSRVPNGIRARRSEAYASLYKMLGGSYWNAGQRRQALRALANSFVAHPVAAGRFAVKKAVSTVRVPRASS